jgi:hypothetical protein
MASPVPAAGIACFRLTCRAAWANSSDLPLMEEPGSVCGRGIARRRMEHVRDQDQPVGTPRPKGSSQLLTYSPDVPFI